MVLRTVINWGWAPILITAAAITGYILEWPVEIMAPVLGGILVIGLIVALTGAREKQAERSSAKLGQLSAHFNRRFLGDSSLSIFTIIDSLFKTDNPKLWEWARACDMTQRVINSWGASFIHRLEVDTRTGRLRLYLRAYLNELWLINGIYYEFIEQFYDVAEKIELPPETLAQYRKFVPEYNAFVENLQTCISDLRKVGKTEIEPPSVKLAKEAAARVK